MAELYLDNNGATEGFGNLTYSFTDARIFYCTRYPLGNVTTDPVSFILANNVLNLGSASTSLNTSTGTITIVGGQVAAFNGIRFQNLATTQTIAGFQAGYIMLGGTNPFIDVTAVGRLDITCRVSGTVNWEKRGTGTLLLNSSTSDFSAGMTISAGTVQIGNASALGTGTVTMTGGKLSSSSTTGYSLANALTLNGTMTLGDATNNGVNTFSGILTVSGSSVLTAAALIGFYGPFQGSGSLSLGGSAFFFEGTTSNTYSGAFTQRDGAVVLAGNPGEATPNQLGTGSITLNGGLFEVRGNTTHTFTNTISGVSGAVINNRNTSASGITFDGSMASYTGSLRIYADSAEGVNPVQKVTLTQASQFAFGSFWFQGGGGLTTLSQTLSYTGTTAALPTGIIIIYSVNAVTTTAVYANNSTNNSGITHSNVVEFNGTAGGNATLRLQATSGPFTFNSSIYDFDYGATGKLSIVKEGTYAATFTGIGQYRGTTSVSNGTLNANSATALGSTSGGAISVTSGATLSLGAAPTYTSRSLTVSGTGVSSTVGALVINNALTNTFQSITLGSSGTYIRATNSGLINAPFTSNNNSVVFGASAGSNFIPFASLSNVFSGTGSVTYGSHSGDTGIVRADVRHTYTGNTTLAYGTTYVSSSLELSSTGGPLGNKSLTAAGTLLMTGGTLSYLSGNVDYSGRFSTAGSQQWKIDARGQTVTYATNLLGASLLSMFDSSTGGSLTLSSSGSTFSGGVNLIAGTLNLGAQELKTGFGVSISGPLGLTGAITFTGGTLRYSSVNQNDYSARFSTNAGQQWRIDTNGENVIFASSLTSTGGSLFCFGGGTLTLAAANTYNSGTTLSLGTLKCGNVQSLGIGASAGLAQANGTTLHVTASGGRLTITGAHTNTGTGSRTIRIGAA